MVRRVARREALKQAETKRAVILNEDWTYAPVTAYNTQYMYAPVFAMLGASAQGVGQGQYIGTEIVDPLFVARMEIGIDWGLLMANGGVSGAVPVVIHAWLISTNDQVGLRNPQAHSNSVAGTQWFLQTQAFKAQFNGNNVRVLKHWSKVFSPPSIPFSPTVSKPTGYSVAGYRHKFVYRWKGKKEFEETDNPATITNFLRGANYYFIVGYGTPSIETLGANSQNVYIRCDRYLYYKDP